MNTQNPSNTQTDLSSVLKKIAEIVEKSANDGYIYRGEPDHYDTVSSTLYREHPHIEDTRYDIAEAQKTILEEAKTYISKTDNIDETDDIEILTELQHFGGKTNLIDFTEDYLIALFFACDGSHETDGRVILIKRESDDYKVKKPRRTINRVDSQKSVFIESPAGFIKPDIVVTIPADLKMPLLDHIRKYHRISIETIYNDLHGFIRRSAYIEFIRGITCLRNASEAETPQKKDEHCKDAIRHYTEALKLNPDLPVAYSNRGAAYFEKGDFDAAIQDYNKAIDLEPNYAKAYYNRGAAYLKRGEVENAVQDYSETIRLEPNFEASYNNRGAAYLAKGDFDAAIRDYNKAIDLNPNYADAYCNRGNTYLMRGDVDNAIRDYNKAIDLNPDDANAYCNRGNAYANKGDVDNAIQDYNKAIDLNPNYDNAYNNRGRVWLYQREWEKAKADIKTAKEMGRDIVASFHNDYGSIEDFEAKHGMKVPEDIAALLRRD